MLSNFSFSLEFEVFYQSRVFIHSQNYVGHSLQRSCKELANVELTILINTSLKVRTEIRCIPKNFIHILMFVWIAFQSELQKGSIKIKSIFNLTWFWFFNKFFNVYWKQFINTEAIFNIFNDITWVWKISWKSVHQSNENWFHIHLFFTFFRASVKKFRKSIDMKFLWETLDHTVK